LYILIFMFRNRARENRIFWTQWCCDKRFQILICFPTFLRVSPSLLQLKFFSDVELQGDIVRSYGDRELCVMPAARFITRETINLDIDWWSRKHCRESTDSASYFFKGNSEETNIRKVTRHSRLSSNILLKIMNIRIRKNSRRRFIDDVLPRYIKLVILILSRIRDSVTNNNEVWIGWLDLLTPSFTITLNYNHNRWLPKTRSISYWTTIIFYCDWLGSDLRIGHFFSFRRPLVNTPQLKTQLRLTRTMTTFWLLFRLSND
jgi:hypothetical protein